jgi:hypothetical protein
LPDAPSTDSLSVSQRFWRKLNHLRERVAPVPPFGVAFDPVATGQAASDLIYTTIQRGTPAMIARLGSGELEAMLRQFGVELRFGRVATYARYVLGQLPPPWWDAEFLDQMELHPGFFPATPPLLALFTELMLRDLPSVDVLGSWLPGEALLLPLGLRASRVPLEDLEPYFHDQPWSRALRDRVVLVIHPHADLIRAQYQRREALFPGREVLPSFELKTFAPVLSHGGAQAPYPDWFAALDAMIAEIERMAFDVAIIGAGAYGFPLAAAVKRMGRQAVHLGGATQILFGIRGRRWDHRPSFQRLYTEAWARPDAAAKPPRWREMEDSGSYW